ncbi:MAG: DEAD/DEAH box helicase family protein [Leptospiraceae bacterium]|nr:DEAD/DEAH box helicase family protein [Leptospiraceae bacterium]
MTLKRFSSRKEQLDKEFLAKALDGAKKYLRIAGYFRSSIFELVGEEISRIPEVKILCNSELELNDFQMATQRETLLKEKWNQVDIGRESFSQGDRYQKLDELLKKGNVEIRVVPKERIFIHGKAGVITDAEGQRTSFVGSVNDSKSAFSGNYELVWQDDTEESANWVEEEFYALWKEGIPLPEVILDEIHRFANRREITVSVVNPTNVAEVTMVESPIYRGGEQLQPWQRSFVTLFLQHREIYKKARLLIADEVGLGKTLSMATSALVSSLLEDGNVLVLAPSTLCLQWQTELKDKLGISSAVWNSSKKVWIGVEGQFLSPRGNPESIKKCPYKIGIVSTGLVFHQKEGGDFVKESGILSRQKFGTVILDEAHKARVKGGFGNESNKPNNLLEFMFKLAKNARHVILGTATPIQTRVREVWDLLEVLNTGANFVLGDDYSRWHNLEEAIDLVKGDRQILDTNEAWEWLRNPLPPNGETPNIDLIRENIQIHSYDFVYPYKIESLDYLVREVHLAECLERDFFKKNNPLLRHIVLRKRVELEDQGLLDKVGVDTHPLPNKMNLYRDKFIGLGLYTNPPFEEAYRQAEEFCKLLQQRTGIAGFMKTLMLQRICSSFYSGLSTARKMLKHSDLQEDGQELFQETEHILNGMESGEIICLKKIIEELSRDTAVDPKLNTILYFLKDFQTEGKTWLEHGCIIFSQYFDTARWVAKELALKLPGVLVGLYAGAGKSGYYKDDRFNSAERNSIKEGVKTREVKLLVATDAACEGLNLQTLGTLINIDLPWNPSRLEQRLGRIKRFGQVRKKVDMLNLVYYSTQDEHVYNVLSTRLKDTYDIFGSLPDTIEDDWIESEEKLKEELDFYIHKRKEAENAFSIKYRDTINPNSNRWEKCSEVLSRRDIELVMGVGW